jgi:hypothetical protein
MPFGLANAPAVFQRLMQKVLAGVNPEDCRDFVMAYLNDILVFSSTLEEHLCHLRKVVNRLKSVNLNLKPAKCQFARGEVEYLGHMITPSGWKPKLVSLRWYRTSPGRGTVIEFEDSLAWHPTIDVSLPDSQR